MSDQQRKRTPRTQLTFVTEGNQLVLPVDFSHWAPDRPAYQCRGCGWILPDLCYRLAGHHRKSRTSAALRVRSLCVACVQERQDAYNREHRFEIRARRALGRHRRIERDQGLHGCSSLPEYEQLTGVTVGWLANEMELTYSRPDAECPHCFVKWTEMPNGLRDLTVDRTDRQRTLSRSNIQFMCPTGNSQKGVSDARSYELRQALFREKRRRHHPST